MSLRLAHVAELGAWLVEARHVADDGESLMAGLVHELRARGLPLWRASLALTTMHPEVFWRTVQWHEERGVEAFLRPHELIDRAFYQTSPVAALRRGEAPFRVKLTADAEVPFPICADLRAQGATDYLAQGLAFSNGEISYASWATRAPGGFEDEAVAALVELGPWIARRAELESAYYGTRALLEVYLGRNAARRVLSGDFRRGGGELIDAAIWFCDLRDFTAVSDRAPPGEVVEMLDAYFDRVAGAIGAEGGEVLKFVGDAVLAIFPVGDDGGARGACRRALAAAEAALEAVAAHSLERERAGRDPLRMGIALHLGQVMYGNIGARDRLDFTVISSSVNEACRLEALCKPLGTPLMLSASFAGAADAEGVVDLGEHALKGVSARARVHSLARYAPRTPST